MRKEVWAYKECYNLCPKSATVQHQVQTAMNNRPHTGLSIWLVTSNFLIFYKIWWKKMCLICIFYLIEIVRIICRMGHIRPNRKNGLLTFSWYFECKYVNVTLYVFNRYCENALLNHDFYVKMQSMLYLCSSPQSLCWRLGSLRHFPCCQLRAHSKEFHSTIAFRFADITTIPYHILLGINRITT